MELLTRGCDIPGKPPGRLTSGSCWSDFTARAGWTAGIAVLSRIEPGATGGPNWDGLWEAPDTRPPRMQYSVKARWRSGGGNDATGMLDDERGRGRAATEAAWSSC